MEEYNTPDDPTLGDNEDGDGAGSEPQGIKDVIGKHLNKEFPTDEAALKSVKDTYDFVGKTGKYRPLIGELESKFGGETNVLTKLKELTTSEAQQAAEEGKSDVEAKLAELNQKISDAEFYSENPEYKPYKNVIRKFGDNPTEVIQSEDFKKVYEALKSNEEQEKSKSVLHSNSRLGQVSDKYAESKKKAQEGDLDGAAQDALSSVIEGFDLDK